jgi:hypothetical protein
MIFFYKREEKTKKRKDTRNQADPNRQMYLSFVESIHLTVRLLVPGAGTATTELLGLRTAVVGNEECAVVLNESLLQLVLGVLVDVLLVVGNEGLGDGLTDGVDLGGVTTTGDADADIDAGEFVGSDDENGLVDLFIIPS